jgi:hypothetical protein
MSNFKAIPGYEELYAIDTEGNVMRIGGGHGAKIGKILKPQTNGGYYIVNLWKNKKMKHYYIHRLVAMTHIGEIPDGYEIDHINRIKTDNRVENLRICTGEENRANQTFARGKDNGMSRLVLNTATGIFYDTIKEAAESIGMNTNTLRRQLVGMFKNKTSLILI